MSELTHDEIRELLGVYALDAVDGPEVAAVQAHLQSCEQCAAEVAEHHEIAAMLGNSGGDAPAHVWERIAAHLEDPSHRGQGIGGAVVPMSRPLGRQTAASWPGRPRTTRWLAAAAAVIVLAAFTAEVVHLQSRVSQLEGQSAQQQLLRAARTAVNNRAASTVTLESSTRARLAQIAILPSGAAFLLNDALPALPASRTYQLWGLEGTRLVSLGLLGSHPTALAFQVGPRGAISSFAVTDERAGGVVRSHNTPVAVATY